MFIRILLILVFCLSCAHKSGYYKRVGNKWTFVSKKTGFYDMMDSPRVDNSEISITEKDMFSWPVPATKKVSSSFGKRAGRHHDGIDIPSSNGSHIIASADGKVTFSGWMRGYGRIVVIKHSHNFNTVYAHNSKNYAKKGEKVSKGQVIAQVGNSGKSTGPHLHFEIRKSNKVVNPMKFFGVSRQLASKH